MSITNAVMATAALIRYYFPEQAVSERKLMLNMGITNEGGIGNNGSCRQGQDALAGQSTVNQVQYWHLASQTQ